NSPELLTFLSCHLNVETIDALPFCRKRRSWNDITSRSTTLCGTLLNSSTTYSSNSSTPAWRPVLHDLHLELALDVLRVRLRPMYTGAVLHQHTSSNWMLLQRCKTHVAVVVGLEAALAPIKL
ncbi:GPI-anchored surface protein, putative, partial [Bodo saltans]